MTILTVSDLSIAVSDGTSSAVPGDVDTYTLTVTNNGPDSLSSVDLVDTLPAALSGVTFTPSQGSYDQSTGLWSGLSLASGQSVSMTLSGTIDPGAIGFLVNTATVSAPSGVSDPSPGNNSATDIDMLTPEAYLAISNSDGVTSVVPGTETTYTIAVTNEGPSTVTGAQVSDLFPSDITGVSWTDGITSGAGNILATVDLAPGATIVFTATAEIDPSAPAGTNTLVNTATVSAPPGVTDLNSSNSATDIDSVRPQTDIAITNTDGVASVAPGEFDTYTIVVSNSGPSAVTGEQVTDLFPSDFTAVSWTSVATGGSSVGQASGTGDIQTTVNLAAGGSATFIAIGEISPSATGTLSNTASVTAPANETDLNPSDDSATDTDTITSAAQTGVTITNSDGIATAVPGDTTAYTIVVTNNGSSTVTDEQVTDLFPSDITAASWTAVATSGSSVAQGSGTGDIQTTVTLAAGGSATFTAVGTIDPGAIGFLANTATVSSTTATAAASDIDTLTPEASLVITTTDGVRSVVPGTTDTYIVTVSNDGPSTVTGAQVSDLFSSDMTGVTWSDGITTHTGDLLTTVTLTPGAIVTFMVSGEVDPSTPAGTNTFTNTATVSAPFGVADLNSNNSSTDTDSVAPQFDVGITNTDGVTSVTRGEFTTYTIVVTNNGPSAVTGEQVTDLFPSDFTDVSWTSVATGGSSVAQASGTGNIQTTVDLAAGGSATFIAIGEIGRSATGTLSNTALVTAPPNVTDSNPANDSATDTDTVVPCYCPGTHIRTARGEKRVETLRIGDKVMTASGALRPIKWIGRRGYAGRFIRGDKNVLPICIRAGALDDKVPKRDLWVSPHHALYLDSVLIEAKDLVNGVSIVQADRVEKVEYFHIELDSHDVIIAEGALAESYIDDHSRALFHNAHEYDALYPTPAPAAARYCAPRLDEGYAVEAVRQRIAARAGLLRIAGGERMGTLCGHVEQVDAHRIAGWAQCSEHPKAPVCLDIFADGKLIGQVLANHHRAGLDEPGAGRRGFEFFFPRDLSACAIDVRRSLDGALLQSSPAIAARQGSTPGVKVYRRVARR